MFINSKNITEHFHILYIFRYNDEERFMDYVYLTLNILQFIDKILAVFMHHNLPEARLIISLIISLVW